MSILQLLSHRVPLNIAHRGARSLAPENTLAAALKAFETGAPIWELDVAMTRDGRLLVIHDTTLQRTSNVETVFPRRRPWNVRDFSLEEIRRLDFGSWFMEEDPFHQIRAGAISAAEQESFRGLAAPTLGEALELTRQHGRCVNVEIKDLSGTSGHRRIVPEVLSLIDAMGMKENVIVSSFNQDYLAEARGLDSEILLGVLTNRSLRHPLDTLRRLGALSYHPKISSVDRQEVGLLRKEGFHVMVWVANDSETFRHWIHEGVSGIFTDFPQNLATLLKEVS
jgi:glycerophosphoryl diester phosphodiesterase